MLTMPALVNPAEIRRRVKEVEGKLAPDVVRIRYDIGQDWTGDWAIFFRTVLSDSASHDRKRPEVTDRVVSELRAQVRPDEQGLLSYFNFRSRSEQTAMRDKDWA